MTPFLNKGISLSPKNDNYDKKEVFVCLLTPYLATHSKTNRIQLLDNIFHVCECFKKLGYEEEELGMHQDGL